MRSLPFNSLSFVGCYNFSAARSSRSNLAYWVKFRANSVVVAFSETCNNLLDFLRPRTNLDCPICFYSRTQTNQRQPRRRGKVDYPAFFVLKVLVKSLQCIENKEPPPAYESERNTKKNMLYKNFFIADSHYFNNRGQTTISPLLPPSRRNLAKIAIPRE